MKQFFSIIYFVMIAGICKGQFKKENNNFTYQNFDKEILKYEPAQREGVINTKFDYAKRILEETKSATKGKPENLNAADFWNITTAFVILKEPKTHIELAFKKAISLDPKSICSYITTMGSGGLDKLIPESFFSFYENCTYDLKEKAIFNVEKYANDNHLNLKVVSILNQINLNDQKYRLEKPIDWSKQAVLDLKNQKQIDSLYSIYKTYLGKSIAGKNFESTMWAVIQHSNVNMMERYLPDVAKAVQEKELNIVPFKMLIDRIYSFKYKYQIFGSQVGVDLADEKTRVEIIKKYKAE